MNKAIVGIGLLLIASFQFSNLSTDGCISVLKGEAPLQLCGLPATMAASGILIVGVLLLVFEIKKRTTHY